MRKIFRLILVFFIIYNLLSILNLYAGVGTSGAQFLKIRIDAKTSALGGTGTTSNGVESIFLNPSGLAHTVGTELRFSQVFWIETINYSNIAAVRKFNFGTLGLGINYLSVPAIEKYDNKGVKQDEKYSPIDIAFTFGYSNKIKEYLSYGVNIKYILSRIDFETARAFGVDLGVQYLFSKPRLKVGFTIQNIGTQMKYNKEGAPLPLTVKLGLKHILLPNPVLEKFLGPPDTPHNIEFNLDMDYINDSGIIGRCGIEYIRDFLGIKGALRLGYSTNFRESYGLSGLSAGVGMEYRNYTFDYAYALIDARHLGNSHRITIGAKF